MSPSTRLLRPLIETVARESVATATAVTEVVPAATFTVSPPTTAVPATAKVTRVLTLLNGVTKTVRL